MQPPRGFQLVPDPILSLGAHAPIELEPVPVHLTWADDRLRASRRLPAVLEHGLVVEPVRIGSEARLAMVTPRGVDVRVNGSSSPRVALLDVGDEVRVDGRVHLHVTMYNRPEIVRAGDVHGGRECPVCRGVIEPDARVYVCPRCGDAAHCEVEDEPASRVEGVHAEREALPCARLTSECCRCGTPVILTEGYAHVPDV